MANVSPVSRVTWSPAGVAASSGSSGSSLAGIPSAEEIIQTRPDLFDDRLLMNRYQTVRVMAYRLAKAAVRNRPNLSATDVPDLMAKAIQSKAGQAMIKRIDTRAAAKGMPPGLMDLPPAPPSSTAPLPSAAATAPPASVSDPAPVDDAVHAGVHHGETIWTDPYDAPVPAEDPTDAAVDTAPADTASIVDRVKDSPLTPWAVGAGLLYLVTR